MLKHIAIALALLTATAAAQPRKHKPVAAKRDTKWMRDCLAERTDAGQTPVEARKLCKAEQPEDDVAAAQLELKKARSRAKIAKLADRVRKAIDACEEAVAIACEDSTERSADHGECSDETLRPEYNRVCFAQEGK